MYFQNIDSGLYTFESEQFSSYLHNFNTNSINNEKILVEIMTIFQ